MTALPFNPEDLYRPSHLRTILAAHSIRPKRSLGQNFLHDRNVLQKIVRIASLSSSDTVLEVGAGLGHLTRFIAAAAAHVFAVETDARLLPLLRAATADCPNVTVIHADILAQPLDKLCKTHNVSPSAIVANLPYYLTTDFVEAMVTTNLPLRSVTLTLQKEAAERLTASPGQRSYGPTAVLLHLWGSSTFHGTISPSCFVPQPSVHSSILHVVAHNPPLVQPSLWQPLNYLVHTAFNQRRKTFTNALAPIFSTSAAVAEALAATRIPPTTRPEAVPPHMFLKLTAHLLQHDPNLTFPTRN